jgi:MFS transporter, PPP family, 3-phenylpropionic acid transporter
MSARPLPYWRLSLYYFFYFAFIGVFSPYFTLYLQALAMSAADIALLMSQMQLMRLVAPAFWGWLADKRGRQVDIIRLSGLCACIGFTGFFLTDNFIQLFIPMTLMAFFWSAALPLVESLTFSHLADESHRYSRIRVWGSVGFIVAVLLGGALLDHLPISDVPAMVFVVLLGILVTAFRLPEGRRIAKANAASINDTAPLATLRSVVADKQVWMLLLACFLMSSAHGVYYVFYSIHLDELGYSKGMIGLLWSLGVLVEIGLFMVMAPLMKHYSLRALLLATYAVAVVRFLMIGWGAESLLLLLVAQAMHGLTFGVHHAAAIAAVNQWFPQHIHARGQALYSSISFGGGGLFGGIVSGLIWDPLGAGWAFTLGAVFSLAGWFCIARGMPSGRPQSAETPAT